METTDINPLVKIMDELREKCPWDRKQTIPSLRQQSIEEFYELTDALLDEEPEAIKEELGDLLLHIVFYAKIASEKKWFTLQNVIDNIAEKLIRRHPHIYGDVQADTEEQVKKNWEKIKLEEGKKSVLSGIPNTLPSLVKAIRIQEKVRQTGFEWENKDQVWEKVEEEKSELLSAVHHLSITEQEQEAGDLLFSLVNYIRFLGIDADKSLELTNRKFIERFQKMESIVGSEGKRLHELSLSEMDHIWNQIKKTSGSIEK